MGKRPDADGPEDARNHGLDARLRHRADQRRPARFGTDGRRAGLLRVGIRGEAPRVWGEFTCWARFANFVLRTSFSHWPSGLKCHVGSVSQSKRQPPRRSFLVEIQALSNDRKPRPRIFCWG